MAINTYELLRKDYKQMVEIKKVECDRKAKDIA